MQKAEGRDLPPFGEQLHGPNHHGKKREQKGKKQPHA